MLPAIQRFRVFRRSVKQSGVQADNQNSVAGDPVIHPRILCHSVSQDRDAAR